MLRLPRALLCWERWAPDSQIFSPENLQCNHALPSPELRVQKYQMLYENVGCEALGTVLAQPPFWLLHPPLIRI